MQGIEGLFLLPVGSAALVAAGTSLDLHSIVAVIGVVSGCAGAIYTTRNRATLNAKTELANTLRGEVDVYRSRGERLEVALRDEQARRSAAEARTDITSLAGQIAENHREMVALLGRLVEITEGRS
jgi:uncharacterized membrane protein YccC